MDFSEYQTEIIEDIKSCLEGLQVQPILFMGAGVSQLLSFISVKSISVQNF